MRHLLSDSLSAFMRRAIRFLLPVDCTACGLPLTADPIPYFCSSCWAHVTSPPHSRCARCDRPLASPVATSYSPGHMCQSCVERPPSFTKAWTLYPYLPPLQDALCLFKYRGKIALASPLARLMVDRLPPLDGVDLIMPVPLHTQRLREREFNQSLLLADRIGRHVGIPVSFDNLTRTVPSPPQTTLSRKDRLKNLRRAFTLRRPGSITDKRILLIDDVFTTGTTVNECAKTLRRAGSSDVFVLTLGRTMDANMIPDRILARSTHHTPGHLGG